MDLGDRKTVYTPEQVAITYTLAGLGTRFAAAFVDTCLQAIIILAALLGMGLLSLADPFNMLATPDLAWWEIALLILVLFLIFWGYYMFWETLWSGQTPGKRACGLRVLRDGGFPIDFRAAFIRNVVRVIDFLPGAYGVGALSMFLSKDSKRLGDYAAGTIVVADARQSEMQKAAASAPTAPPPEYRVLGDLTLLNLRAISREQFGVVEHFLSRRAQLPEKVRAELAKQLAVPLMSLIGFTPPAGELSHDQFLAELAVAYRNQAGA